jgi:hypothetical protein
MNARRYPRSMSEAFGPYTDHRLHPMPERRRGNGLIRSVLLACAIGAVLAAAMFFGPNL